MSSQPDRVAIGLRIPRDLHEWLQERAELEQRSLNAQMVWLLQQARDAAPEHPASPAKRRRPTGPRR